MKQRSRILNGDRIGATAALKIGAAAALLDCTGARVLRTQRSDNGQWCLPGGGVEAGEREADACLREV